ncbi:recombinase family protein [Thermaerobacillus caldiproteolyticus]|uniref:Putative transcriptional regulator n=1 Tax=Thermaerobacillus caldiproteolyticus TaxID=247480 RepID=A0A7V9Z8A8_9BACL|nr:recombinase family protein [Anoxybacillus caldiproteolyticus]MBA2875834.1 putative transcriptional regulator [Anoxybacillus caldiproteolyticus]
MEDYTITTSEGVRTRRGALWHDNSIRRLFTNQVYLGRIIDGKTEGSLHKNRPTCEFKVKDPEEWVIVENTHPPLLTEEEFAQIQQKLIKEQKFPTHSKKSKQLFSGLLFCGKCGKAMTSNRKYSSRRKKKVFIVKKCQAIDENGNVCGNKGIHGDYILEAINTFIKRYEKQLFKNKKTKKQIQEENRLLNLIEEYKKMIPKMEQVLEKNKEMFIAEVITIDELKERNEKQKKEIEKAKSELRKLETVYYYSKQETAEERKKRFEEFVKNFDLEKLDTETANNLLKTIIDKIILTEQPDGTVHIHIQPL